MPDSRLSAFERASWGLLALCSFAVLLTAAVLEPNPRGMGTHTQLGLPPCGFLTLTGFPCPGCGLTTAFAHGIRGQWLEAASANPLGLALFVIVCVAFCVSLVAPFRGWRFADLFDRWSIDRWGLALAAGGVAIWIARLAVAA
ncbi:MAG: DUF2752 domain-containing protein [Myxococcota bacterium]